MTEVSVVVVPTNDVAVIDDSTAAGRAVLAEATAQADIATSAATSATTQADIATSAATSATTQAGIATSAASTATTQAGIATAQATIATTQAGLAVTAKTAAETARDAAFVNADIYASIAAGLAAVAVGGQFQIISADLVIRYRVDAGPVATEVARFPAADYVFNRISDNLSQLSGYVFALEDENGRAAIAIEASGNVTIPGSPVLSATTIKPTSLSTMAYAICDESDRLAFGIDTEGNVVSKGTVIDLVSLVPILGALDPTSTIDCWGDSLTQGNTSGVTVPYPTALATLLTGRTIRNNGRSGRTSLQIGTAFGGVPSILTVTSNTIPASGAVTVTTTETGNFSSKANFGSINTTGSLFGIPGTLNVAWNSSTPELPGTSTFTRTTAGSSTVIPNRTPFIPNTGDWENNTVVIWNGRNDIISAYTDPTGYSNTVILANIQAMVDFLKPLRKRFVILTVTDANTEYAAAGGTAATAFNQILALNYEIAKRWPRNYVDVRKILVNSYNSGSTPDVTAFGRDQVPPSLQADGLHFNNAGYAIVAQAVADFITAKGW